MGQFLDLHIPTCGEDMPFRHDRTGLLLPSRQHYGTLLHDDYTTCHTYTHSHRHVRTQTL